MSFALSFQTFWFKLVCGILVPCGFQLRTKPLVVNLLVFTLLPVVLASGFRHSSTILRASAANKNFKRTPAAPLKLALAAVFLPELQT
ncbi:hypothetical protein [Endozoicomonas ascidiicola]|uniref:hypothetical protein n=1 Tax=Endozoicomonas ascidiicola TaxID=1698521 RepID=UPI0008332BDD|nr:hypothetical protein [Endozoicomonas ascidiicola]